MHKLIKSIFNELKMNAIIELNIPNIVINALIVFTLLASFDSSANSGFKIHKCCQKIMLKLLKIEATELKVAQNIEAKNRPEIPEYFLKLLAIKNPSRSLLFEIILFDFKSHVKKLAYMMRPDIQIKIKIKTTTGIW